MIGLGLRFRVGVRVELGGLGFGKIVILKTQVGCNYIIRGVHSSHSRTDIDAT